MPKFMPNQWVECIDARDCDGELTVGYRYRVLSSMSDTILILNDQLTDSWYCPHRFKDAGLDEKKSAPTKIENEQVYMFDVDDTLIVWDDRFGQPGEGRVHVVDPYDGVSVYLRPHVRHVKLLKQMRGRGRFIVVWSQSGVQWAEAVVDALGLKDQVHLVMTKPQGYVDDLPVNEWMQNRIYLEQEEG